MRSINELKSFVGQRYRRCDENGKALGCMMPLYLAFPEENGELRFDWCEIKDMEQYMTSLFNQYCVKIDIGNLQPYDFLLMKMPFQYFHVGIYLGNGEVLHCQESTGTEIIRLSLVKNRIRGVYRWQTQ
jgi:hypothetical protein